MKGVFEKGDVLNFVLKLLKDYPETFTPDQISEISNMLTQLNYNLTKEDYICYYEVPRDLNIVEVVDIFVKVNSGGQKLDDADLILSIATGENESESQSFFDIISDAIKEIGELGFKCDKKFILTTGLLITGAEKLSLKRPENYSRNAISKIVEKWDDTISSIKNAVIYFSGLGFNVSKLSSSNLIIPIAYYFNKTNRNEKYIDAEFSVAKKDRAYIRQWIFRTMINSVFSDATGDTLVRMRKLLNQAFDEGKLYFPLEDFMNPHKKIKKEILIKDNQIEEILEWQYGDVRIEPLLMEIAPDAIYAKHEIDHIWPKTIMAKSSELKKRLPDLSPDERSSFAKNYNLLPNLQLLTKNENDHKNKSEFGPWVNNEYSSKDHPYYSRNFIPKDVSYDFDQFNVFYNKRAELIKNGIRKAFPDTIDEINKKYGI